MLCYVQCTCTDCSLMCYLRINISFSLLKMSKYVSFLGGESVRKVRRTNSFDSADVIKAAGESSQTDPTAFIEQQRQMLDKMKSAKSSSHQGEDVDMRDEDKSTQIDFQDDHFKNSPPNSAVRDSRPITTQPGFSNAESTCQEPARKTSYPDYVHIEENDYEQLMAPHEGGKYGMSL